MKQRIRNIFILSIACLVFFVGAGVTIINLCCINCIPMVFSPKEHNAHCLLVSDLKTSEDTHSCCNENSMPKEDKACTDQHDEHECGTTERISVDINNTVFKPTIANPLVWSVMTLHTDLLSCLVSNTLNYDIGNEGRTPIPIPPREYLSLIRILII